MSIQSSVNSMLGSASRAIMAVKGYQALRKQKAPEAPETPKTEVPKSESAESSSTAIPVTDYTVQDADENQELLQPTSPQMVAMQRAEEHMMQAQEMRLLQRSKIENFRDSEAFKNSVFTVMGKKVPGRDLPPKLADAVDSTLTDEERYAAVEREEKRNGKHR